MEKQSRVKSQLTDKVYEVSLDDLDEEDDAFDSELYRINVFGKNLIIAPGRPIKDKRIQGLVYFYVYVIKNEKAIAKLGIYEITTSENKEIYDLTTFPDGALLLFDIYYNKPLLITEYEEIESTNKNATVSGVNIFDYLNEYVVQETNAVGKIKEQNKKITSMKISCTTYYTKQQNPALGTTYKELLNLFKDTVIDKALLKTLKTTSPEHYMFVLYVLEMFLNVRFIYIDEENTILSDDEYKKNIKMPPTISSNMVVVRLGQTPTLVKVYEPDTPREIIEQEITALSPYEAVEEEEKEEVEEEEDELGELEVEGKTQNPLNKGPPIGTSLNSRLNKPEYSTHSPEFGQSLNKLKSVGQLKPLEAPTGPPVFEPQTPDFGPLTNVKLNNTPRPNKSVNLNNSNNSAIAASANAASINAASINSKANAPANSASSSTNSSNSSANAPAAPSNNSTNAVNAPSNNSVNAPSVNTSASNSSNTSTNSSSNNETSNNSANKTKLTMTGGKFKVKKPNK